jgi:anhydro-N-acetylmuramic acid kinase
MKTVPPKAMTVAGVMSGTSADGVDVAICRIAPGKDVPRVKVLGHRAFAYDKKLRAAVLAAMDANQTSTAELARLSWRLGEVYAECVAKASAELKLKPQLIACHGQTVYHQATEAPYLGKPLRTTWQMGEAAVIAQRLRLPVVSDFRPADIAVGGQGAPLVPMLDFCMFRHPSKSRVLLNVGGIANVTVLPAGCSLEDVMAFDTGPGNMVIDAAMQALFDKSFDRDGKVAARGRVLGEGLARASQMEYFSALPPKSCGREEFGATFAKKFIAECQRLSARKEDVVATAMELTVVTVFGAYVRYCWPHLGQYAPLARETTVIVAGGGTKNTRLMERLRTRFAAIGVKITTTADAGLAIDAKEAAAFALLGWLTWNRLPGNVPLATGASRAVVLGKVTLA